MKTFHLVFFFMMLLFAFLQWNDVDRGYWILIYLATSVLCVIAFLDSCIICTRAWALLLVISCIFMLAPTLPGVITFIKSANISEFFSEMQNDKPYIEQVREFSGILIIIVYCIITLYKSNANK